MTNDLIASRQKSTPSLPRSLDVLLREVADQVRTGSRRVTISRQMTRDERSAVQTRLRELNATIDAPRGGTDVLAEIARMLSGFSVTTNLTQTQSDAKVAVYEDAIGDLPAWAIVAARKAWARGETDKLKGKVDPSFPPAPAHVRALALDAMAIPAGEASRLRTLLDARVTVSLSDEQRRAVLQRLPSLVSAPLPTMPPPPRDLTETERTARLAAMAAEVVRTTEQSPVDESSGGQ